MYNKSVLLLIALGIVSTYLTAYAVVAHIVARHIYETEGIVVWRSAPSGSFFPLPTPPGMLQVLSGMSRVDEFIYIYLIKPWILVTLTTLLWALWFFYFLKLITRPSQSKKRNQARSNEKEEEKTDLQELRKRLEIPPPS